LSGEELRVAAEHVGDLAARQARASAEVLTATHAVEGVDAAVRSTHGAIASATSGALQAVLAARSTAGNRMAGVSDALREKLTGASTSYDRVDEAAGATLDRQVTQA
jgi:Excreted virulence factor EspC, type VII ESX diderm